MINYYSDNNKNIMISMINVIKLNLHFQKIYMESIFLLFYNNNFVVLILKIDNYLLSFIISLRNKMEMILPEER